jgi:hypothetical protein
MPTAGLIGELAEENQRVTEELVTESVKTIGEIMQQTGDAVH